MSQRETIDTLAVQFLENSTVHGIKYIGNTKSRSLLQKSFWFVCVWMCFLMCGYLIARVDEKRRTSPVIVSFNEAPIQLWQIPFPAVTICPETKSRNDLFRFTDTYLKIMNNVTGNVTKEEMKNFNAIAQLCELKDTTVYDILPHRFKDCQYIKTIQRLAPIFNETLLSCYFRNVMKECEKIFSPIMTEAGLCYTFNGLPGKEIYRASELSDDFLLYKTENTTTNWSIDSGYYNKNLDIYPERGLVAGIQSGFFAILKLFDEDFDYICGGTFQGFQVILHNPAEHPHSSEDIHKLQLGTETTIKVHPQMTITTPHLKDYAPNQRGCFFSHERYLKFFQIYTKSNCEIECTTNYTLSKCGCVKFFMPRNKTTRICGVNDIVCYNTAAYDMLEEEIVEEMEDENSNACNCNCLPVCNSIDYDADVTDVVFDWEQYLKAAHMPHIGNAQLAKLNIFFKQSKFIVNKRSELYNHIDFLANCGGLIGMFVGASLLSCIEIFYFCLLRFIVYFKGIRAHRPVHDNHSRKKTENNKGIISVVPVKTINGKH